MMVMIITIIMMMIMTIILKLIMIINCSFKNVGVGI